MTNAITFDSLVDRLKAADTPGLAGSAELHIPERTSPFVPQPLRFEVGPDGLDPLAVPVVLVRAPAAVGKSTFARQLAASTQTPILDLSQTPVSTHSLSGLLVAEFGASSIAQFVQGDIPILVDALDEGILLSNSSNWEQFLKTSFQLIASSTGGSRQTPCLILFGRVEAVEVASILLELDFPELLFTELALDFFDEPAATELAYLYALNHADDPESIQRHQHATRRAIDAFFGAIAGALDLSIDALWDSDAGRGFAGYAPVLAALGALIANTENFAQLESDLRETGTDNAWVVLEDVAGKVLRREAGKLTEPLAAGLRSELPPEAFDPAEQLYLLTCHLLNLPLGPSARLHFSDARDGALYVETVKAHLMDHPFLRGGEPVNSVLGSLILADAAVRGVELGRSRAVGLLDDYGRQPFLWRFFQGRSEADTHVEGRTVGHILASMLTDSQIPDSRVRLGRGDNESVTVFVLDSNEEELLRVSASAPLALVGTIERCSLELPTTDVELVGW
jgi:hypothetical protein